MKSPALRVAQRATKSLQSKAYSTSTAAPRHLMSISDLKPAEFANLVRNAASRKALVKAGNAPPSLRDGLAGQTIAMMFSKRSTRTRVSTEAAVTMLGGHPMFLGKDDIQLGVSAIAIMRLTLKTLRLILFIRLTNLYMIPQSSSHP